MDELADVGGEGDGGSAELDAYDTAKADAVEWADAEEVASRTSHLAWGWITGNLHGMPTTPPMAGPKYSQPDSGPQNCAQGSDMTDIPCFRLRCCWRGRFPYLPT